METDGGQIGEIGEFISPNLFKKYSNNYQEGLLDLATFLRMRLTIIKIKITMKKISLLATASADELLVVLPNRHCLT